MRQQSLGECGGSGHLWPSPCLFPSLGRLEHFSASGAWADCVALCCYSVAKSHLTLCDPMDCSMPGFPVLPISCSLLKLMSVKLVMPSNHLILCHPLLFLPSIFPSIRVFSNCQLFATGGQSIGVSVSTSVFPMNTQD